MVGNNFDHSKKRDKQDHSCQTPDGATNNYGNDYDKWVYFYFATYNQWLQHVAFDYLFNYDNGREKYGSMQIVQVNK
jgi:hypothetical protein